MIGSHEGRRPRLLRLFGERNSGTNLVESLLLRNFPSLRLMRPYPFEKHAFFAEPFVTRDMVCVCVTRAADSWLRSSFRSQHQIWAWAKGLDFAEFLRHEWWSHMSGHVLADRTRDLRLKQRHELLLDRHPVTGRRIADIVELRGLKLQSYLKIPEMHFNHVHLRYEDVVADQAGIVRGFAAMFDLPLPEKIEEISANLSRAPEVRHDRADTLPAYADFTPEDVDFIRARLDFDLEARFGYRYSDAFALMDDDAPLQGCPAT